MYPDSFNRSLLAFLDASPTPFHATSRLVGALCAAGFTPLDERERWQLAPRGRYVVTRNDSSLIAFALGALPLDEDGLRMVGAHTDSPCLKLKPRPELVASGCTQLAVEVYGGVLLNPWFDRDLSLAGRVTLSDADGRLRHRLVDFRRPLAVIPSLAIHLDRDANDKRAINRANHLPAVIGGAPEARFDLRAELLREVAREAPELATATVEAFELCLHDLAPARLLGWDGEFIAAARLDNLLSCHTGMCALRDAPDDHARLLVCNDHEEVGSSSTSGARGNFLESVLSRLLVDPEARARALARSLLISADNAHAVHPNFAERHDAAHSPVMNKGPAVKTNANQSYATNSESAALLRRAAAAAGVPLQDFIARPDMGCGSTIGPLAATRLGVRTVDVGVPTLAMHSIRELAGSADAHALYRVLLQFYAMAALDAG